MAPFLFSHLHVGWAPLSSRRRSLVSLAFLLRISMVISSVLNKKKKRKNEICNSGSSVAQVKPESASGNVPLDVLL